VVERNNYRRRRPAFPTKKGDRCTLGMSVRLSKKGCGEGGESLFTPPYQKKSPQKNARPSLLREKEEEIGFVGAQKKKTKDDRGDASKKLIGKD